MNRLCNVNSLIFTFILIGINFFVETRLFGQVIQIQIDGCEVVRMSPSNNDSFVWTGDCINGKANGFGKLTTYRDKDFFSVFNGNLRLGVEVGFGKVVYYDSSSLEGDFVDGQINGIGKFVSSAGDVYVGNFINGNIHGVGEMKYLNGSSFIGFFVNGSQYDGEYKSIDDKINYVSKGEYVDTFIQQIETYNPQFGKRVIEYFDKDWKRCEKSVADYFRVITYDSPHVPNGIVKDYYINGDLQSEYTALYIDYIDENRSFYEGQITFYYNSGILEKTITYKDNLIEGKIVAYFEDGKIKSEESYILGELNGESKFWYPSGRLNIFAIYEKGKLVENQFIEYDELGNAVFIKNADFNKEEWLISNDYSESYLNDDNDLVLKISASGTQVRLGYINLNQDGDFSIETRMLKFSSNKKARYGLIFGFKDWDNYHKFTITDKGSFEIFGVYDGVSALIATSKKSKAIYTGEIGNTLKIQSIGDEFYFSINGIEVFVTDGFLFRGNYFGFVANAEGGYVFESLRITEDLTERELKEVGPKVDKNEWAWYGSGFFIHPTGLIATNFHVIENSDTIEVNFFQKGVEYTFRAEIIACDSLNDIAVIKITDSNFKPIGPIPFVFKDYTCEVGTDVFALGYPDPEYMGYEIKYTDGIISSKTGFQGERNRYQTTVPIYGGNSGGPLFDKKGNLVGINTAIFEDKEAVTYAVKSNYLKLLIDSLPGSITCPDYTEIYEKPLTEKIKLISDFVPFIRVK